MKRPFTLITGQGSSDTALCVEQLQADVRANKLIGLAYVAIYAERNYEVHTCGEAERSPTFTRGAVGVLAQKLMNKILGVRNSQ